MVCQGGCDNRDSKHKPAFENRYKAVKRCGDCPHFTVNPEDRFSTWCERLGIPVHRKQKPNPPPLGGCPTVTEIGPK